MTGLISSSMILFTFTGCGGGDSKPETKAETKTTEAPSAADLNYTYTPEDLAAGEAVYQKACIACHAAGIAGAAALTNTERWEANRAKGMSTLQQHVFNGFTGNYGTMPPKGACVDCDEEDLKHAILYMLKTSGVID